MRVRSFFTPLCLFTILGLNSTACTSEGVDEAELRSTFEMSGVERGLDLERSVAERRRPRPGSLPAQVLNPGDRLSYTLVNDSDQVVTVHLDVIDQDSLSQAEWTLQLEPDSRREVPLPDALPSEDNRALVLRTKVRVSSSTPQADPSVEVTQRLNRASDTESEEVWVMDCTLAQCVVRPSSLGANLEFGGLERLRCLVRGDCDERSSHSSSDGEEDGAPEDDDTDCETPGTGPGPTGPHGPGRPECPEKPGPGPGPTGPH